VRSRARRLAVQGWRRSPNGRPLVLGHRGARREAPENTLPAFELAVRQGADGVELDVRLDGSGRIIVLHDRTLERVTRKENLADVESLSAAELDRVRLAGDARVPSLPQVLEWAERGGHRLNVELKRDVSERRALLFGVAKLFSRRRALAELVLFSSFDPLLVRGLAWLLPSYPVAWLVHAKQRVLSRAPLYAQLGAVGVHPELALASDARVRRWRRSGALVNVWTVNEPADALRLGRAGVDALISDVPGAVVAAFAAP